MSSRDLSFANYQKWLQSHGLIIRPQGIWAVVGEVKGSFGWKLHLSSTQTQALSLLEVVTPILLHLKVPFKVARDEEILGMLNEGSFGPTQVGKFITVYPDCEVSEFSLKVAEILIDATNGLCGPRILSDLHLEGVVYARYGSFSPPMERDRLGNVSAADPLGAGAYKVPFVPPVGIPNPFVTFIQKQQGPATHGLLGSRYLLIDSLNVHVKGSVYSALDLSCQENVRRVVLKEGRRHCVSDVWGRDIHDRLRHQQAMHNLLSTHVRVPKCGELFENDDKLYLPLEFVSGYSFSERHLKPFSQLEEEEQVQLLQQLSLVCEAVGELHARGVVHRDLSPRNIRIDDSSQIWLLDLELSHQIDDSAPAFPLGTSGFMSPQQEAGASPSFSDDTFALGALLVMCLTGMDPHRVLYSSLERVAEIVVLSGAPIGLCQLAANCISFNPIERPEAAELGIQLSNWTQIILNPGLLASNPISTKALAKTVTHSINWLLSGSATDESKRLWISPEIEALGHDATLKSPHAYKVYRSCSRGVAGVLLALCRLHRAGFENDQAKAQCNYVVDWLLDHELTPDDQMPGLHFGEAGVAVAIAEAIASGLVPIGNWLMPYIHEALRGPIDWPDITHGAAGQGIAALSCARLLNDTSLANYADLHVKYLLQLQEPQGEWKMPEGVSGMEGICYTGFAHGMAGITYFLASYSRLRPTSELADAAEDAATLAGDRLAQLAIRSADGSLAWPMWIGGKESWRWWCHGSPGIALGFLELARLKQSDKYASLARDALRSHPTQPRHSNLSQCHGLSGLGEIMLNAHHLLDEREWLDRALSIGEIIYALAHDENSQAAWLVENPFHPTADLMIGCSGVAHFLARLSAGSSAQFGMPLALD